MSTFAAYEDPVSRVINLSAPPQATTVNNVMKAATYFTQLGSGHPIKGVQSVFGLVSTNDSSHYDPPNVSPPTVSVYEAVWQALGYNLTYQSDYDVVLSYQDIPHPVKQALVCNPNDEPLAYNFAIDTPVSPGGGHVDPTYIWNEDIYIYMLLDN